MSAPFQGSPEAFFLQAMSHAQDGSAEQAQRLRATLASIDRRGEVSPARLAALDCLLALRRRDPAAARRCAEEACAAREGCTLLSTAISNSSRLPPGAHPLLADLLVADGRGPASRRHIVRWSAAALIALVCGASTWVALRDRTDAPLPSPVGEASRSAGEDERPASPAAGPASRSQMHDHIGRVVVYAKVVGEGGARWELPISSGTAFAVAPDGLMLTNRHVFEGATDLDERFDIVTGWGMIVAFGPHESEWFPARVEKASVYQDLAVLRIDRTFPSPLRFGPRYQQGDEVRAWGFPAPAQQIAQALNPEATVEQISSTLRKVRDSEQTHLSDWLTPAGFELVTTRGIISAIRHTEQGRMVQTDATIHSGNSGGPLLNTTGEVIGVVTFRHESAEGIGMAIGWESLRDELESFPGIQWP